MFPIKDDVVFIVNNKRIPIKVDSTQCLYDIEEEFLVMHITSW